MCKITKTDVIFLINLATACPLCYIISAKGNAVYGKADRRKKYKKLM